MKTRRSLDIEDNSAKSTDYNPNAVVQSSAVLDLLRQQAEMISLAKSMLHKMSVGHFSTLERVKAVAGIALKDMANCGNNPEDL